MASKMPEIIGVNSPQLKELLERATSNTLSEEDTELIGHIFDSYVHFFEIVGDKNTTIARLRKLLFGASSEKTEKIIGEQQDAEALIPPVDSPVLPPFSSPALIPLCFTSLSTSEEGDASTFSR